jgi:hypothetical protein
MRAPSPSPCAATEHPQQAHATSARSSPSAAGGIAAGGIAARCAVGHPDSVSPCIYPNHLLSLLYYLYLLLHPRQAPQPSPQGRTGTGLLTVLHPYHISHHAAPRTRARCSHAHTLHTHAQRITAIAFKALPRQLVVTALVSHAVGQSMPPPSPHTTTITKPHSGSSIHMRASQPRAWTRSHTCTPRGPVYTIGVKSTIQRTGGRPLPFFPLPLVAHAPALALDPALRLALWCGCPRPAPARPRHCRPWQWWT